MRGTFTFSKSAFRLVSLGMLLYFCCNLGISTALAAPPDPTPSPAPVALPNPPKLTAHAAIAIDADTGRVLFSKNPNLSLPMASTTKIMTALTLFSIPGINLDDYTVVVEADLVGEATMGLYAGQRLKVIDLLYGTLLDSANDAATALARYGGTKLGRYPLVANFVAEMNRTAGRLGLKNSSFQNPHGLDEYRHYTSAYDLAVLGWYALQNPTIASIVRLSTAQLDGFYFYNISNFIRRYAGATGIKPGETDNAGLCLVASAYRNGHNAIIVLLDSPGMRYESDQLMDYAFSMIQNTAPQIASTATENNYLKLPYRFANGAFREVWQRTDLPISQGQAARSWYWGPKPLDSIYEPYAEASGKQRLVQYFDKARMEINAPDKANVSNGLLVVEMLSGRRQEGDNTFVRMEAAKQAIAGDSDNSWPTYASLNDLYLLSKKLKEGQSVTTAWTAKGQVEQTGFKDDPATKIATTQNGLGIPQAFWEFLNRKGKIFADFKFGEAQVSDWIFSTGFPITEAYWTKVKVGGVEKDVLFQAFERRTLTYTPTNPAEYRVEMGNVGLHYLAWRYPKGLSNTYTPAPLTPAQSLAEIYVEPPTKAHYSDVFSEYSAGPKKTNIVRSSRIE